MQSQISEKYSVLVFLVIGFALFRLCWGYGEKGMYLFGQFGVISDHWKPEEKICRVDLKLDYKGSGGYHEKTLEFKLGGLFHTFHDFNSEIEFFGEGCIDFSIPKEYMVQFNGKLQKMTLNWSERKDYDHLRVIKDWE